MPHDPRTEQRVGAIVREELALFWEDLDERFQKLGAGFRSALENYDSALQSHDRKHQELQQFLRRLALGRRWVGDHEVSDRAANRHAFGDVGGADLGHEDGLAHSSSPSLCDRQRRRRRTAHAGCSRTDVRRGPP